jgi:hypothetical protein
MALVRLPQVEDLAVQCDDLFHLFVLCDFPDSRGDTGRARHEQHAGLYFEDVRVPVFALVLLEGFVEAGTDHVFDADEAGIGFGRVVEKALSHLWEGLVGCWDDEEGRRTIVQVSTVVVGFDATGRVVGICMESIEMSADTLGWGEVLGRGSSGLEDLVCDGLGLALGIVGGWYVLHDGYRCTYLRWLGEGT